MIASLYLPLMLLTTVGGIGLAFFAWYHRETPGAAPLALFLLAASGWSLAEPLSVASGSGVVWWALLKYAISTLLSLSWLLVVFQHELVAVALGVQRDPRLRAVLVFFGIRSARQLVRSVGCV